MSTKKSISTAMALLDAEPAVTVRGYLIDPTHITISQIEYNGTLEHLHQLIGCRCIDLVELDNGDVVFVDDEGLFTASVGFLLDGRTLAGKGVVLGTDSDGDSTHAKHTLQQLVFKTRMGALQRGN